MIRFWFAAIAFKRPETAIDVLQGLRYAGQELVQRRRHSCPGFALERGGRSRTALGPLFHVDPGDDNERLEDQATYSSADLIHVLPKGATIFNRAVAYADYKRGNDNQHGRSNIEVN
jgi:hypothetical protein